MRRISLWKLVISLALGASTLVASGQQNTSGRTAAPASTVAVVTPAPTQVKNVDEPARHPFVTNPNFLWADGNAVVQTSFTVPLKKRLVIEFLSATAALQPDQKVSYFRLALTTNGTFGIFTFPAQAYPEIGGGATFLSSQSMRLYADPGTEVFFLAVRNADTGSAGGDASISGYLVDIP